jgi:Rod binding domain-containing protein
MDASPIQFNPADLSAWRESIVEGSAPAPEKLAAVSREFEAVLLRQFLDEALKPMAGGEGLFGSGPNNVYGYLFTDALSRGLTAGEVFGISNVLQAQLGGAIQPNENDADLL